MRHDGGRRSRSGCVPWLRAYRDAARVTGHSRVGMLRACVLAASLVSVGRARCAPTPPREPSPLQPVTSELHTLWPPAVTPLGAHY